MKKSYLHDTLPPRQSHHFGLTKQILKYLLSAQLIAIHFRFNLWIDAFSPETF
jgi:hypothetical protein